MRVHFIVFLRTVVVSTEAPPNRHPAFIFIPQPKPYFSEESSSTHKFAADDNFPWS
jgi:hypothetical protein